MNELTRTLRTLADPTRLRILRLLAREALNVGEMTTILGVAQPSVSRHLGELKRTGLVQEERNGAFAYYRLDEPADAVCRAVAGALTEQDDAAGDLARLTEVVRRRTERGGGPQRLLEPGRSWPAWARALGWLIPPVRVADLGCGDGALTAEVARWAREVVAIDHDPDLLEQARIRFKQQEIDNVRIVCEPIEALSLADASMDVVILSQALHHASDPAGPLAEAGRILVGGGRLLLLDLGPHTEDWVRSKLGHVHLGFKRAEINNLLTAAGFENVHIDDMQKGGGQPFRVLVATGTRASARLSGRSSTTTPRPRPNPRTAPRRAPKKEPHR